MACKVGHECCTAERGSCVSAAPEATRRKRERGVSRRDASAERKFEALRQQERIDDDDDDDDDGVSRMLSNQLPLLG